MAQGSVATWATLREAARRSETSLLINPAFVPFLLFFLGIGVIGAYARRFVINRFGLDLTREAAGVCLLLFAGAAWGLSQHNPAASRAGVILSLLALILSFLVLGAWTLRGEMRSPRAWLLYVLLATLLFALIAMVLLVVVASTLPTGWSIA